MRVYGCTKGFIRAMEAANFEIAPYQKTFHLTPEHIEGLLQFCKMLRKWSQLLLVRKLQKCGTRMFYAIKKGKKLVVQFSVITSWNGMCIVPLDKGLDGAQWVEFVHDWLGPISKELYPEIDTDNDNILLWADCLDSHGYVQYEKTAWKDLTDHEELCQEAYEENDLCSIGASPNMPDITPVEEGVGDAKRQTWEELRKIIRERDPSEGIEIDETDIRAAMKKVNQFYKTKEGIEAVRVHIRTLWQPKEG
eukprot:gene682-2362_t